jgi:hypothetical protein
LPVEQLKILLTCANLTFEMETDRPAMTASRVACRGKRFFRMVEPRFYFLSVLLMFQPLLPPLSIRHSASRFFRRGLDFPPGLDELLVNPPVCGAPRKLDAQ